VSLLEHSPLLAQELNLTLNGGATPSSVPAGTKEAYWWRCYKGHEWKASVRNRTKRGDGCPYCSGRYPIIGETDLATTRPDIALSWHPSLNKDLRPTEVSKGSSKKVWWVCDNGHEFQCSVANRTKGVGCGCMNSKEI